MINLQLAQLLLKESCPIISSVAALLYYVKEGSSEETAQSLDHGHGW